MYLPFLHSLTGMGFYPFCYGSSLLSFTIPDFLEKVSDPPLFPCSIASLPPISVDLDRVRSFFGIDSHTSSLFIGKALILRVSAIAWVSFYTILLLRGEDMENVKYEEEFILNSSGLKLFTCRWLPVNQEPKAVVFLCHGYAVECSITMRGTGVRLAKAGYAVYGIDYVGHGKSSGLQGYIPSFDQLVNDCSDHFTCISEKIQYKNKMRYLLGESMGGAVALLLHRKKPKYWDGAILVAPMCKIAEKMKPHPFVIRVFRKLSKVIPEWKIVPTQDIIDMAVKNPEKRKEIRSNPYCYKGKPRLRTAQQLLTVSLEIEKKLDQVTMPFLIVHGEDDTVTDPEVSKLLYNSASSTDKTLKMYPSMWHALTSGESPEDIEHVFSDIVAWLDERSEDRSSRSEKERKADHDNQFPDLRWRTIEIEG